MPVERSTTGAGSDVCSWRDAAVPRARLPAAIGVPSPVCWQSPLLRSFFPDGPLPLEEAEGADGRFRSWRRRRTVGVTVAGGVVVVPVEAPAPRWDAERVLRVDIIKK